MAIVRITNDLINSIIINVADKYENERYKMVSEASINKLPIPKGDELYSLVMPLDKQQQVLDTMPEWVKSRTTTKYMNLRLPCNHAKSLAPCVRLAFDTPRLALPGYSFDLNVPGTTSALWQSDILVLNLKSGGKDFPDVLGKDYIIELQKIVDAHDKISIASEEATETMRKFLSGHRTMQTALKEFGPALLYYTDPWIQSEMKRIPEKRVRIPAKPKEPVEPTNLNKLIAKATASTLNI